MAGARQAARDALARSKGFQSDFAYRNFLATEMGYSSYGAQRAARRTGIGLQGSDLAAKRALTTATTNFNTTAAKRLAQLAKSGATVVPPEKAPFLYAFQRNVQDVQMQLQGAMAQGPLGNLLRQFGSTQADIQGILNKMAGKAITGGLGDPNIPGSGGQKGHALIQDLLKGNFLEAQNFIKAEMPKYYMAGLTAGAGAAGRAVMSHHRQEQLQKIQTQAIGNMRRGLVGTDRSTKQTIELLRDATGRKNAQGILNRNGARAVVYADGTRRTYGDWAKATTHALTSRLYNTGYIDAAVEAGATKFIVSDGPGCGWADHNDPLQADGLIVSADDAGAYPIAHPNCVRTFEIYNGPKDPEKINGSVADRLLGAAEHIVKDVFLATLAATAEETLKAFVAQQGFDVVGRQMMNNVVEPALQKFMGNFQKTTFDDIVDISTGKPVEFTADQFAQDARSYADAFATEASTQAVPEYLQLALTGTDSPTPVELGKEANSFFSMMDRTIRPGLSLVGDFFGDAASQGLRDTFFDSWAQLTTPENHLHFSFPGITRNIGDQIGIKADLRDIKYIKGNITRTLKDSRANVAISPNALIRAGFHVDTAKGSILQSLTPSFRINLPGPLRIQTTLNRATKEVVAHEENLSQLLSRSEKIISEAKGSTKEERVWKVFTELGGNLSDMMAARHDETFTEEGLKLAWDAQNAQQQLRSLETVTKRVENQGQVIAPVGRVLSMSTKVNIVSPRHFLKDILGTTWDNNLIVKAIDHTGIDLGASMRWDLKRLGLETLGDIKDLKWTDFQKLVHPTAEDIDPLTGWHLGQSVFRMVDITSKIQLYGGDFFDFLTTLRLKYENYTEQEVAKVMWRLGRIQLEGTGQVLPNSPFKQQIFKRVQVLRESPTEVAKRLERERLDRSKIVPIRKGVGGLPSRAFTKEPFVPGKTSEEQEAAKVARGVKAQAKRDEQARLKAFQQDRIKKIRDNLEAERRKNWVEPTPAQRRQEAEDARRRAIKRDQQENNAATKRKNRAERKARKARREGDRLRGL